MGPFHYFVCGWLEAQTEISGASNAEICGLITRSSDTSLLFLHSLQHFVAQDGGNSSAERWAETLRHFRKILRRYSIHQSFVSDLQELTGSVVSAGWHCASSESEVLLSRTDNEGEKQHLFQKRKGLRFTSPMCKRPSLPNSYQLYKQVPSIQCLLLVIKYSFQFLLNNYKL